MRQEYIALIMMVFGVLMWLWGRKKPPTARFVKVFEVIEVRRPKKSGGGLLFLGFVAVVIWAMAHQ